MLLEGVRDGALQILVNVVNHLGNDMPSAEWIGAVIERNG
jgi:hypothetical protein